MAETQLPATATYDARTIWFHWVTAAFVAAQWLGAHAIDQFPRGVWRTDVRSAHIVAGLVLAAVIVARILWRRRGGVTLPSTEQGALKTAAAAIHGVLYLLIISVICIGILNTWIRRDNLFDLFRIPKLGIGGKPLREQVGELHELVANLILLVAGLHAAAAIWHQYVRRDGVLARMVPHLARRRP